MLKSIYFKNQKTEEADSRRWWFHGERAENKHYGSEKAESTAIILLSNHISVYFVHDVWYKNEEDFVAQLIY